MTREIRVSFAFRVPVHAMLLPCGSTWTPRTCRSMATDPAARQRSPIDHTCWQPLAYPHVCRCSRCGQPIPGYALTRMDLAEFARRVRELHSGDHNCPTYDHHGDVDSYSLAIGTCPTLDLLAELVASDVALREQPDDGQDGGQDVRFSPRQGP